MYTILFLEGELTLNKKFEKYQCHKTIQYVQE